MEYTLLVDRKKNLELSLIHFNNKLLVPKKLVDNTFVILLIFTLASTKAEQSINKSYLGNLNRFSLLKTSILKFLILNFFILLRFNCEPFLDKLSKE